MTKEGNKVSKLSPSVMPNETMDRSNYRLLTIKHARVDRLSRGDAPAVGRKSKMCM
jgi:hypothetical protein